jgi:iron complex transport system substrate-binding protein
MKLRILLWTMILTLSCSAPEKFAEKDQNSLSYATGFDIRNYSEFQQINIYNPWQKSQGESFSYFLTSNPESLPDSIRQKKIIKTPVKRVIVFSSTHVGFLAAIGKSSSIVGVSGKGFISDSTVLSSLENKKCLDIGFSPNIDFESILLLNPDLVFLYGLDPSVTSLVKRLEEAGIKSVLVSEYLEGHPLGKAEWIRFFSVFFECGSLGDSIYRQVERNYLALKDSADNSKEKPGVLVGLPWKDTWYMAGGKSFTAKFIEDAGGRYLWKDNTSSDYIPLDLESVFQKAVKADIWINTGSALNKTGVLSIDTRFQYVPAFQKGKLFNNNLRINDNNGNDFWESGAVRPDLILGDLISIFHPDKFGKHQLYYYRRLE